MQNLVEAYGDSTRQVTVHSKDIIDQMQSNLDVFANVLLPEEFTEQFSESHHIMWRLLTESVQRGYIDASIFDRFALGLPRGHGKTTLLKLLIAYIILFTKRRFIVVMCSNYDKAASFVADVVLLLESPNVVSLFGQWNADASKDSEKSKKFFFRGRRIILKPKGVGGSIRGFNEDFQRPDVIVCDDIQEKEDAEDEVQGNKLLEWFLSTLLKARNSRVCTICYLGNMYRDLEIGRTGSGIYACLLRNLEKNPEWQSMIVGAILADGTALWQRVISIESLLSDLNQDTALGKEDLFFAESQNDPSVKTSLYWNPSKIPELPYTAHDIVIGKYLVIDPSLGKKKSDAQMVGEFNVYDDQGPVCVEMRKIQKAAPQLVEEVLLWAFKNGIPVIAVEAVAYQGTLVQWIEYYMDMYSIEGVEIIPVTPKGYSKVSRILSYMKSLMHGTSMATPIPLSLISHQAAFYKPTATNNVDDILDVGAYGEQVFLDHSDTWLLPLEPDFTELEDDRPLTAKRTGILSNARIPR